MFCSKCGNQINLGEQFCKSCGTAVQNAQSQVINQMPSQQAPNSYYQQSVNQNKGNSPFKKTLMIIGGIVLGIIVLAVVIIAIVSLTSKKMVCKSPEGNITIMYSDKAINGYTATGMSYNLDEQQKYAEQIGVEQYLEEFSTWFSTNTSGSCQR